MFLKKITLVNFRNYHTLDFKFISPITILIGKNAQGKSNFLESIYILATGKSPKAEEESELIENNQDFFRIEGDVGNKEGPVTLEVAGQQIESYFKKRAKVNGIPKRVVDYAQNLAVVQFSPEDINLVTGSPSLRREHINSVISQVDKKYKKMVSSYEEVITRKNKVLKAIREGFANLDQLIFWTDQQILLGGEIAEKRKQFFEFLNSAEKKFGAFQYQYLENVLNKDRLKEYQEKEIDAASSLIGPHRDDFGFLLDERDLSKFGSRGEQRTSVLDLKLAESLYIEKYLGERPLMLLDDIFSELDLEHQQHVIDISKLQQTIITSVEIEKSLQTNLDAKVFSVENGQITGIVDK